MDVCTPMSWGEFKSLPKETQKEYIEFLQENYSVTAISLAEMFGVTALTVRRYLSAVHGIKFVKGRKMKPFEEQAWDEFTDGNSADPIEQPMGLRSFSFEFSGKLDINAICDSLRSALGDFNQGSIEVVCKLN